MIPSKREWRDWTTFERANYIAQILVPVSLLVTVVFSYLGWRAALAALEIQKDLFQAQNSPRVEFASVAWNDDPMLDSPILFIRIKNSGQSRADGICVTIQYGDLSTAVSAHEKRLCDHEAWSLVSLQPGMDESVTSYTRWLSNHYGYPIDSVVHGNCPVGNPPAYTRDPSAYIGVRVEYTDMFGEQFHQTTYLSVCASTEPPSTPSEGTS